MHLEDPGVLRKAARPRGRQLRLEGARSLAGFYAKPAAGGDRVASHDLTARDLAHRFRRARARARADGGEGGAVG
jgi:hypothetical protein